MARVIDKNEMGVFGTLNYEVWKNLTEDNQKFAVKMKARECIKHMVRNGEKFPSFVCANFTIMSLHTEEMGKVHAYMTCNLGEDEYIELEIKDYEDEKKELQSGGQNIP